MIVGVDYAQELLDFHFAEFDVHHVRQLSELRFIDDAIVVLVDGTKQLDESSEIFFMAA